MTIEEKAQRYDETLEQLKGLIEVTREDKCDIAEEDIIDIFPELKESEDEKIRKELIEKVKETPACIGFNDKNAVLTWLEKQGDKDKLIKELGKYKVKYTQEVLSRQLEKQGEPTDINPSEFDLRLNKLLKQFETLPKEELASSLSFYLNVVQNDGTYKAEEKQDEQKPAYNAKHNWYVSKVDGKIYDLNYIPTEPKFKVGDWIVDNCGYVWKIEGILNQFYILKDIEGGESHPTIEWTDNTFHLWSIRDAKDGDVLADEDNNIGIFQECEDIYWNSYIYLGCDGELRGFSIGGKHEQTNTHPATKEQRDILFKKMKEKGYKWDAEKKELKKIEQKPADKVEPKFHKGEWVVYDENIYQIHNISLKQYYECLRTDGTVHIFDFEYIDSKSHLWTIADAKPGDVLASELCDSIILFKGINDDNNIDFYCDYDFSEIDVPEYWFSVNNGQHYGSVVDSEDFHPATKEQRNTLFEKMEEAGYKWDAEKLELKKIEQKPIWNNRDENYIKSAIELIMHCAWKSYRGLYKEDVVEWLKSLKHRFAENNEELN